MIEVGEEEDTRILSAPQKKILAIRKTKTSKNPKAVAPMKRRLQKKHGTMTTEGEGVDEDEEPCVVEVLSCTKYFETLTKV